LTSPVTARSREPRAGGFRFDTAPLTIREIIRLRVQQEVERFNRCESELFQGLMRPELSKAFLLADDRIFRC
jgi:hypothetical protein